MAILQTIKHQFFDSSGNPLSGGKLYTYAAGTSTPKDTYTDQGGLTANANPVVLDSRGEASIWFSGSTKVVLKTAADATIYTVDNIQDPSTGYVTLTGTETLTNKTLTSPAISSPTVTGSGVVTGSMAPSGAGTITATTANTLNSGEVTVTGHATTADIFGAAANSILFDDSGGAITVTAIPAASKAGLTRDVRYNGATKYTAGANLIIEGIPSGTTITLASGAEAHFRAITTTQFKMTYSVSGTFTATGVGWTTSPTCTVNYTVANGVVDLVFTGNITGTSNSISTSITGSPAAINPLTYTSAFIMLCRSLDNGVQGQGIVQLNQNANMSFYYTGGTTWTASGTKTLYTMSLSYKV